MTKILPVGIDARLHLPPDIPHGFRSALKRAFTHANPDYFRKKAMGFGTWSTESKIKTFEELDDGTLVLPRGGVSRLRELAHCEGYKVRFINRMYAPPQVQFPRFCVDPDDDTKILRPYQVAALAVCLEKQQGIVRAPTGCLAGSTEIGINRAGKSFKLPLSEVVHRFNGGIAGGKYWRDDIPTTVRSHDAGFIRLYRIDSATSSGIRPVFKMTVGDRDIVATACHRFLTPDGWLRLDELSIGTTIAVEGVRSKRGTHRRLHYRIVNEISNLEKLTHSEHRAEHAPENTSNVQIPVVFEAITSIAPAGEEETFDLTVPGAENFVANSIVAHNSGKTTIAYAFIHAAQERTIVLVRDKNLADQWIREAVRCLGLPKKEIGLVRAGRKYRPGPRLTIALQQSLYAKGSNIEKLLEEEKFGAVIVDEVQGAAARTFLEVIDRFPARYRIGFSADERRKDGKEFLIYDEFGNVIYDIEASELEAKGFIHPVTVRMIPTDFRADWYVNADPGDRNWNRLLEEMGDDDDRNELIHTALGIAIRNGETPTVIFTQRREHAAHISEEIYMRGQPCGLMLGGVATSRDLFEESRDRLVNGELKVAVGTFNALGTGINIPTICAGICATPIGKNRQFFGQVKGRTVRLSPGKDHATIYYLFDQHVFPDALKRIMLWNSKRVEVLHRDEWIHGSKWVA